MNFHGFTIFFFSKDCTNFVALWVSLIKKKFRSIYLKHLFIILIILRISKNFPISLIFCCLLSYNKKLVKKMIKFISKLDDNDHFHILDLKNRLGFLYFIEDISKTPIYLLAHELKVTCYNNIRH